MEYRAPKAPRKGVSRVQTPGGQNFTESSHVGHPFMGAEHRREYSYRSQRMDPTFSKKTLSFLRRLDRNNDREWFHAHREEFEAEVRAPLLQLVSRLQEDLPSFAPELVADPKMSLFRQWRDTRFSTNKAPLKTNVAAVFPHKALGRKNGAALYFEVAPKWVWMGGGLYAPDPSQLNAVREHVAEHYGELDALVTSSGFKRIGGLKGDQLSRVPRGFPADHPAAAYLRYRQFLGFREEKPDFATAPHFYRKLLATFKVLAPLCRFLNQPIVAMPRTALPQLRGDKTAKERHEGTRARRRESGGS